MKPSLLPCLLFLCMLLLPALGGKKNKYYRRWRGCLVTWEQGPCSFLDKVVGVIPAILVQVPASQVSLQMGNFPKSNIRTISMSSED